MIRDSFDSRSIHVNLELAWPGGWKEGGGGFFGHRLPSSAWHVASCLYARLYSGLCRKLREATPLTVRAGVDSTFGW